MNTRRISMLIILIFSIGIMSKGEPYQRIKNGIKAKINTIEVEIQYYTPSTVRILKWSSGTTFTKKKPIGHCISTGDCH